MAEASEHEDDEVEADAGEGGEAGGEGNEDEEAADDLVVDVMLGKPGGSTFNTVVLGGTDVVIPLERDLDGDPYQDDEVWLENLDGSFRERLYSSDPDVTPDEDNNVLLYTFRHVPFGVYNIVAVVAARPIVIYSGLVVRKEGVFMGEEKLTEDYEPGTPNESDQSGDETSNEGAATAASDTDEGRDTADGEGNGADDDESPPDAYDEAFDGEE